MIKIEMLCDLYVEILNVIKIGPYFMAHEVLDYLRVECDISKYNVHEVYDLIVAIQNSRG